MSKNWNAFMPLGMVGALLYIAHTFFGNLLWDSYNPITTDISSLTADGAPHALFLKLLTYGYALCMLLFVGAVIRKTRETNHKYVNIGYVLMFVMQLISAFGYALFPLTADKSQMNVQNIMHIIVTMLVVFTTISSLFFIAIGYLKTKNTKKWGIVSLVFAIFITLFGVGNPISMGLDLNIAGLVERLVIYTLQLYMFVLSYLFTTTTNLNNEHKKTP